MSGEASGATSPKPEDVPQVKRDVVADRPVVFVLGDSIAMDYGPHLQVQLEDVAAVVPRSDNGKSSRDVVQWLRHALGVRRRQAKRGRRSGGPQREGQATEEPHLPEVVHLMLLNFGLWDIRRFPGSEGCFVPPREYEDHLREVLQLGRSVVCEEGAVVWVTTTPVEDELHNAKNRNFNRHAEDLTEYNKVAVRVCEERQVSRIDLCAFTCQLGHGEEIFRDHVHFHKGVSEAQAAFLAKELRPLLGCLRSESTQS